MQPLHRAALAEPHSDFHIACGRLWNGHAHPQRGVHSPAAAMD
jgi:hypothetical protein